MKVYVINFTMSSPNQLLSSERLDESSRKLNYKFKEATRRDIHRKNEYYKSKAYIKLLDFHGLRLCKEEQLNELKDLADEANKELMTIDPTLGATLASFSLDMADVSKGETYGQVLSAIRYQIITQVIDKIDVMTKEKSINQLQVKSKEALVKLVDRLKAINILEDKDIDTKLESIKKAIIYDSIEVLKKDLITEMISITKGGAYLKFRDSQGVETPTPSTATVMDKQEPKKEAAQT